MDPDGSLPVRYSNSRFVIRPPSRRSIDWVFTLRLSVSVLILYSLLSSSVYTLGSEKFLSASLSYSLVGQITTFLPLSALRMWMSVLVPSCFAVLVISLCTSDGFLLSCLLSVSIEALHLGSVSHSCWGGVHVLGAIDRNQPLFRAWPSSIWLKCIVLLRSVIHWSTSHEFVGFWCAGMKFSPRQRVSICRSLSLLFGAFKMAWLLRTLISAFLLGNTSGWYVRETFVTNLYSDLIIKMTYHQKLVLLSNT